MNMIICKDANAVGKTTAQEIAQLITGQGKCVLGLATGSTPIPCYNELVRMHKDEGLDFSHVTTFNLDEYLGLKPTHEQSYRYFMNQHLFDGINIELCNTFVPDGVGGDPRQCAGVYEDQIRALGPIHLQILGIGNNGHIGFNEPGSSLASRTRVVTLTEQTIRDNSRFFSSMEEVPKFALTMGIGTILEAERVILLATGAGKADAVAAAIEGPLTASCPASALQLHRNPIFIIDEQAASKLERKEYYIHAQDAMASLISS